MPRDRFQILTANLHFVNNETLDESDPIDKIHPKVDMLNENFCAAFDPGTDIVIDESMRKWRGRLRIRQYNASKSNKYGIKLYKLTTVDSYLLRFKVYTGKEVQAPGELPVSQQVVIDLAEEYLDAGRTIYADNFYSGIPLC
ncbi:hypothetical protein FOCC_FOCC006188 [Frankliniella occidentalis]|nr:hypothetical protein FOCC_FOCC006188 [Frankliniella occidentalis]